MSRILVIDDERVIRHLMCEILERAGHETIGAETSDEALAQLEDDGIALVDDTLPDGDGLEFLRAVKERTPSLPVLMLTSEGAEATAIEAFRRRASDYVVKANGYAAEVGERVRAFLEVAA